MTADPNQWQHAVDCRMAYRCGRQACHICRDNVCSCGLSALREAVAAGDPLAVLDVLGMGGTLERTAVLTDDEEIIVPGTGTHDDFMDGDDVLYRVVRPLPDTKISSPVVGEADKGASQ